MLTREIRLKLTVFALIAAAVLAVMAASYVRIPQMIGFHRYEIAADFADTSGLYPGANVTLRGVDVGKVKGIDLTIDGSRVRTIIDDGVKVPVDSEVRIASTSAIGEQYLEIVPRTSGGPYLRDGGVIARANTVQMPQTAVMLESASDLLQSIPKKELTDVLTNVTTAFQDSGPDMERLVSRSAALLTTAQAELAPTMSLIRTSAPFLRTQQDLAHQTTNYLDHLADFSGQLAKSDPDLRSLIANTAPAAREVSSLVAAVEKQFPELLANSATVAGVADTYHAALQQILVFLPAIVSGAQKGALTAPNGMTQIDFAMNVGNPSPCIKGYLPPGQYQTPDSQRTVTTPAGLSCNLSSKSQVSARGSRNLPCFEPEAVVARAPSSEACAGLPPSLLPSTGFTRTSLPVLHEPSGPTAGQRPSAGGQAWTTRTRPPSLRDLLVPVD